MGNKMLEYEKQWKADMEDINRRYREDMDRIDKEFRNRMFFLLFIYTTLVVVGFIVGYKG